MCLKFIKWLKLLWTKLKFEKEKEKQIATVLEIFKTNILLNKSSA